MNKVKEIIRTELDLRAEKMVVGYITQIGFERLSKLTDEQINSVEGNGIMTADFNKALVKCCVRIANECTLDEYLEFIVDRMDMRDITYDRMNEICGAAIQNLDETETEDFISDCGLEYEEAEYLNEELLRFYEEEE